jgi:hypothetical protein
VSLVVAASTATANGVIIFSALIEVYNISSAFATISTVPRVLPTNLAETGSVIPIPN